MTTHIQCTWSFSSFWQHLISLMQCFEQEPRRQTRQSRYVRKPKRLMPARKICKNFSRHLSPSGSLTSAGSALSISKQGLQNFWLESLGPSTPTLVWHPNNPGSKDKPKYVTERYLPNLFGTQVATNKVLPLGFSTVERSPNPN